MNLLTPLLASKDTLLVPSGEDAQSLAAVLGQLCQMEFYPRSILARAGVVYFLAKRGLTKQLCLIWNANADAPAAKEFSGEERPLQINGDSLLLKISPTDHENAQILRRQFPSTAPRLCGKQLSIGCGDRLGLATPGHVSAVRGTGIFPFFAQQSMREMKRTNRTPEEIIDAASWGVLQAGYHDGFGSDADHLKTTEEIDITAAAGFTLFTVDPGDHVNPAADTDSLEELSHGFDALPWDKLESSSADQKKAYLSGAFVLSDKLSITFTEETLFRSAVKYGRAVAHTTAMYRHLVATMGTRPFELEVSIDETPTPTSLAEHLYVANELMRLGVSWVGLAPRFVGHFEKGVDYIGDIKEFETTCHGHAEIARQYGGYKISLHSGSDKFSVYPILACAAGERVHVKTAGTSYLEALRVLATVEPALFREILDFARERYEEDRASYHVSADVTKVPAAATLQDQELAGLLNDFDSREVLHVTFGSVLTTKKESGEYRFRDQLLEALAKNEEAYQEALRIHFTRHIAPFVKR